MMGYESLTEAERRHYPFGVVVAKARVEVDSGRPVAYLLDDGDLGRLREIERACINMIGASYGTTETTDATNVIHLASADTVVCVCGLSFDKRPFKSLQGLECRLQLLARPGRAWSYEEIENDHKRILCGMAWELDRAYFDRLP